MKAGVKEGDRIIKVSEVPSLGDAPPTAGGEGECRVTSLACPVHLHFHSTCHQPLTRRLVP